MPPPIRTLVVADTVAARRCLAEALANDAGIEVIGTAPNQKIGVAKVLALRPDVVTIAPEMAENGAREMVRAIRHAHPRLPVILFSSAASPGHGVMRELMASGASAFIPTRDGADRDAVGLSIRDELIPKIKALCTRALERLERIDIVAIGVSTGGPNALPVLLSALPGDFPVPIVIVQHMPPVFTQKLAERLHAKCALEVVEAAAGDPLRAGRVSLAPGNFHLVVAAARGALRFELNQGPQENSCRPSVDPLFRSIAVAYGAHALGVVMTGMGRDGLQGCEALRATGGQIIAQDEATSVVWGMPGSVVRAGLADAVLPLEGLASEILRRVQLGRPSRFSTPAHVR
ncbi:MAG TPA: chemotaxis protein CheB [Chthoniobacteraceae bacterium]|jgi:two-component system chemotaxis response regulator CheB|nr:chemotaxis protein CheB [Chthoniobacteraceae bacterium]